VDKLKGTVEKIIFRNPANGYTVLSVDTKDESVVCTGYLQQINAGESMEFTGEYVFHPKYGQQFHSDQARMVMPEGPEALERYLGSGAIKGIGPVLARRIVERFGEDTLRILDEEPERLSEIKGITKRKAQEIAAYQEEQKDLRNVCIFLGEYGISNALAVKLYGLYDQRIYTIIRDNPYQLADEVSGIGFRKADEIARKTGVDPGSDYRIRACIIYILQAALEQGNVYLPDNVLKHRVMQTLQPVTVDGICEIEDSDLENGLMGLLLEQRIIIKGTEPRQVFYSQNYYTELGIARMLADLNLHIRIPEEKIEKRIERVQAQSGLVLDEMQKKAVKTAAQSGILVITGGPGTGKTTTIRALIRYFENEGLDRICLAAPTGRAAKRMTEAAGYEAKTIHRMLELGTELTDSSEGARFNRNEDSPLEADVVIIDEVSMIDIFLMNALLKAIRPGTRLILAGDANQLPSVGPGNILKDIIASECFETVKLVKVFRQATESEIITNAHKINRGESISLRPDSRDFIFIRRDNPGSITGAVLTLLRDKLPGYVQADIRDIQVLSPMKKTSLGVYQLNQFLQASLNPPHTGKQEIVMGSLVLREGDKVMHIRNNYDLAWQMRSSSGYVYEKGTGVFNGDIGIVEKINPHSQMLEVQFDDGKHAVYEAEQIEELTLAYAATIHKSQGSEYPAVILPLLSGPDILMTRNILYTAVTRARRCVVIVGSEQTVRRMIENSRERERYSGLKDRLLEILQQKELP